MRSLVMFFGGAVAMALVVGALALAGVVDDDPAPQSTAAAPPSPPASTPNRSRPRSGGGESISDIYKRVSTGVVFIQAGQSATGSGFVYDDQGHIVTNDHVVEQASSFSVRIGVDTKPIPAQLVGKDPSSDLAVLKVDPGAVKGGLQPINFYACNFIGQLSYHDFEGVTVRDEEGARLLANLGDKTMMLLRNHGILVMGKTVPETFVKHWALQRACEIQLATMAAGKPLRVADEVIGVHQRDLHMAQVPGGPGAADFAAMVRLVDRVDKSWRE